MLSDTPKHYPVLLNELISIITPQHGGTFIDCTFGREDSKKILNFKDTKVIAIDRDKETENFANKVSSKYQNRFFLKTKNLVN